MAGKIVVSLQDATPAEQAEFFRALKEAGFSLETEENRGEFSPGPVNETSRALQVMARVLTLVDQPVEDFSALLVTACEMTRVPAALFLPAKEKALLSCKAACPGIPEAWTAARFPADSPLSFLAPEDGLSPLPIPLDENDLSAGLLVAGTVEGGPGKEVLPFLETLARSIGKARSRAERIRALDRDACLLDSSVEAMVEACTRLLELRGQETEGHGERVTTLAVKLGEKMGLSGQELVDLRRGALLHDIGKLTLPDSLLQKTDPLTEDDWKVMRTHTVRAFEAFRAVRALQGALEVPLRHHERFDGSGYPDGLKGKAIPLPARIFAVVDVWDSLLSDRSYRRSWTPGKALDHLLRASGIQFDPDVVSAFAALLEEDPSLSGRPF